MNPQFDRDNSRANRLRKQRSGSGKGGVIWNVLTILILVAMAVFVMAVISIYVDPTSQFNPFPPPPSQTPLPTLFFPTHTPTLPPTPETPSATPTITLTGTQTPVPPTLTVTVTPTATETLTPGPTATSTIHSAYPFILDNEIQAIAASAFPDHNDCKLWVAGRAYDLQGAPMVGIQIQLGGSLARPVSQLSLTGTALQYGPSGYEFTVQNTTQASQGTLWVQLFDQAGFPLSSRISFNTYDDCSKNLILVNFKQVR